MKRTFAKVASCLLFVFVLMAGFVMTACGEDNGNASIELSKKSIEILLGETENNSEKIRVKVSDAADATLTLDYDMTSISITQEDLGSNVTELTVVAHKVCDLDVTVSAAGKSTFFHVSAITPVSSIKPVAKTLCLAYDKATGGTFELSSKLVVFSPEETGQKGLAFTLADEVDGVSIVDNILTLVPGLETLPSKISVVATSNALGKESVKTTLEICVAPKIVVEDSVIEITETQTGKKVDGAYNLARNSNVQDVLKLSIYIKTQEHGYKILPRAMFENNKTGLFVNEIVQNNTADGIIYDFVFNFNQSTANTVNSDKLYFEFYYEDFVDVVTASEKISITTYDEVTSLTYTVDGIATSETEFNVYTTYPRGVDGLAVKFTALPTNAQKRDIFIYFDPAQINIFDEDGNRVINSDANIGSDATLYFVAKASQTEPVEVKVYVKGEDGLERISKTLTFHSHVGATDMAFVVGGRVLATPTFYLENQAGGKNSQDVIFYVKPLNIDLSGITVTTSGTGFSVGDIEYYEEYWENGSLVGSLYKLQITAVEGTAGVGDIQIKFATGLQIACRVVSFAKLEGFVVDVDSSFDKSASVGELSYDALGLRNIAVKNGHNVPLTFTSHAQIESISYKFLDLKLENPESVYDEHSEYNQFAYATDEMLAEMEFSENSSVVSTSYLKSLQYIAPLDVGKVWIEITCTGKMLDDFNEYVDTKIVRYVMVEIYNPIVSIDVNTKNVTLYPYDEVGEQNRDLSEKTIIVTLNKDNLAPTYYKLDASYENTREGVTIFEFEEIDNYKYKITLKTRTYTLGGINEKVDDVSIDFAATNFNVSFRVQVSIKIESPVLVNKIETINVPKTGIYMSALEQEELARTFKIMTNVLPENALNKNLIFRFEPDFGTNNNILTVNNEGVITLNGNVGGSGHILVIPEDGRMVDAAGREYYREDIGNVLIRIPITIADGTKEETALHISSLEQITNKNLHYLLVQDVVDFSFETLFEGNEFNGGLYGKASEANSFVATITIKGGGSLFDMLSKDAIIKNINIAGTSNSSGMVANVSNGTIQNVNVNVYNEVGLYKATTVTSTNDYAGGLVGENNGLITHSTFAGSISGKTVGGLAGINRATITDSKVEIYNLPTGATMTFEGDVIGGLVGEVAKDSVVQKSYIYNYSDNDIATTMGALVGHIATGSYVVSKCFAYNVVKQSASTAWYQTYEASLDIDTIIYNIKESYISYKEGDDAKFYAHMVNRFNQVKVITTNSYPDVYIGIAAVWNVDGVTNNGYAYLNGVVAPQALTSEQLANMGIVDTNLSMQETTYTTESGEENTIAVMFAYKANGVALTVDEQSALNLLNTISISELVGSALASGLIVSSSNTSIIETNAVSLIVRGTGVVTLTLQSKYDYQQQPKQIKVMVVNKIQDFKLVYEGYTLNSESVLPIKNGNAENVRSEVETTVVLVNREIPIKLNDLTVGVYNEDGSDASFVIGRKIGTHVISSNFGDSANISFVLQLDSIKENVVLSEQEKQEFEKIIERNNIVLAVKLAKGADRVETINVKKANISPIDVLNFDAYVISDLDETQEGLQAFVFDEQGINLDENNVFDVLIEQKEQSFDAQTGKYKIVYNISVSIKTEHKSKRFDGQKYVLRLSSNSDREVYTEVEISVATQDVLRVDFNHYPQMYSNQAGTMYATYQPSNVLSPNRYGLLEISLYPNYASYDYITVTAQAVNGEKLGLVALQKNGTVFNTENADNFVFIENGVRIYRKNNTDDLGTFYVKTIASANVKLNSVYSIEIKVFNEQSQIPLMTDSFNLIIVPQEKAGISINGVSGTTVALKGDTIVADIMVEKVQSAPSVQILNLELNDVSNNATILDVVLENDNYGSKYRLYKATIRIPENATTGFAIRATTSREINNETQYEVSDMKVYLYEFALDPETTGLNNETGSDVFVANKIFAKEIDINIGAKYYGINKAFYESFKQSKIFYGENLRVNEEFNAVLDPSIKNNLKYNLYYVNDNKTTPIYNTQTNTFNNNSTVVFDEVESEDGEGYILTVMGLVNATQDMRLVINYQIKTSNGAYTTFVYEYDFQIKVEQYTDEDVPETVSNATQFIAMADENIEEAKDYILTKDIYLYEWEALADTSKINSLDGNGFTITIMSFKTDLEDSSTLNLSLFNQISQNTTLKNIRLNVYHVGDVQIDTAAIKTFNYAPIAITNNGIITNTEVVAYKKATNVIAPKNIGINVSLPVVNDINSKISGFVIENKGAITNSRVGGEQIKEVFVYENGTVRSSNISLPMFTISGKGEIAGFVYNNSGLISSSFANNIRIINSTDIDYTTVTSGFVAYNTGSVLMSYVKGVKRNDTEVHATKYGIETAGVSTGFVYENDGKINDSYSNITLTNTSNNPGRTSAGFVYNNKEKGQISTSYSFSRIIGSTTTQMNFSGVNERGDYLNKGEITNCYYYDGVIDENLSSVEDEYGKTAIRVTNVNVIDVFYGFSFETYGKENGIWTITSTGPELVSANSETVSIRYKVGEVFAYANGYSYGSKINPIIIRNAKEFNEVLGNSKRTPVQANYSNGYIYGSYRMVNNIHLDTLNSKDATENGVTDYKLTSSSMTLTGRYSSSGMGTSLGKFDGNGLTIYGLALSDTGVSAATDFGLFAKIEQDAMVMNINIVLGAKNIENNMFGIEAKNIQNVGALAGSVHSANVVNISLTSAYEGASDVTVRGKNIVGGLLGNVTGNSYLANLSTQDVSVRAVMNLSTSSLNPKTFNPYSRSGNNTSASYAGGVVGAIDYYTDSTYNNLTFSNMYITTSPNALMLKTKGIMRIDGSTAGGVVGYVGPLTLIQDMLLELKKIDDETARGAQAITAYGGFAGGLVGYNQGYLRQVRAEHENTYQKEIEANVNKYYTTIEKSSIDRGNMQVFANTDYKPYAIGGLVGLMNSGKIEKAYSKLHAINDEASFAGGIIGYVIDLAMSSSESGEDIANIDACLEEVYAFGDVRAKQVSGIIGKVENSGTAVEFEKVNAVNYWGDWLLDDKYEDVVAKLSAFITFSSKQNLETPNAIKGDYYSSLSDVKFTVAKGEGSKVVSLKNLLTAELYDAKFSGSGSYMSAYYDIVDPQVNGERVDVVFIGQEWDKRAWDRDDEELLPHMVFGYISEYFLIRTKTDLNQMRIHKDATFIIVGQSESGGEGLVEIDSNFPAITGFTGTLRGKDATGDYGFKINGGTMTHALFGNTNEAQFIDFVVKGQTASGGKAQFYMSSTTNAMLVNNAEGGVISNVKFEDIHITTIKDADVKTAIAVANSANITFNNVTFNNCELTVKAKTADVGLLSANIAAPVANDVKKFTNLKATNCDISVSSDNVYVGALAGRIKGSYGLTYSSANAIDNVNIKVTGAYNTTTEEQSVYAGLAFGEASSVDISEDPTKFVIEEDEEQTPILYSTFAGSIDINRGAGEYFDAKVYAGGIVGKASGNVNLFNIRSLVNVKVKNVNSKVKTDFAVGGVVGYGETVKTKNVIVGFRNELPTQYEINLDNISGNINVGGVVGLIPTSIKNCITNIYSDLDIKITKSAELTNANIGGFVGSASIGTSEETPTEASVELFIGSEESYAHDLMPKFSLYTGEIIIDGGDKAITLDSGGAKGILNIGGLLGEILTQNTLQSAEMTNSFFGGSIVFNGFSMGKDSVLNVGGLAGKLETNVTIEDNASFGDISLSPYITKPAKEMLSIKGNPKSIGLTRVYNLSVGGLVGVNGSGYQVGTKTVNGVKEFGTLKGLTQNISLTTIINLRDFNLVEDGSTYFVNAIVGSSESIQVTYPSDTNQYSHVVNLATEDSKVGKNIKYSVAKTALSSFTSAWDNEEYVALLPAKVVDYVDYVKNLDGTLAIDPTVNEGTKLNPEIVKDIVGGLKNDADSIERRKHFYMLPELVIEEPSDEKLTNSMLFSDGANVVSTSKNAFIKTVSADSFVSGIVVRANMQKAEGELVDGDSGKYVAPFVLENNGMIFASNVTGVSNNDIAINQNEGTAYTDLPATVKASSSSVSGFVGVNAGTIKDCFTFANVLGDSKNEGDIIAGIASQNNGRIHSSYTSGSIQSLSEKTYVYAFANGSVYDSYTIAKTAALGEELLRAFEPKKEEATPSDAEVENCIYDALATEFIQEGMKEEYYMTVTDYLTGIKTPETSQLINPHETSYKLNRNFAYDETKNYGYPSFCKNGYEDVAYMHHETAANINGNMTYQIPNVGILAQLRYDSSKHYVISNDIDAGFVQEVEGNPFEEITFKGVLDGVYNGSSHTIKNLMVTSALFDTVEGTVQNLTIENFLINSENRNTEGANFGIFGLLTNCNKGTLAKICVSGYDYENSTLLENADEKITFGLIAGSNQGKITSSYVISKKAAKEGESASVIVYAKNKNLTFGGIAGINQATSTDKTKGIFDCNVSTNLNVYLKEEVKSATFTMGGIVGENNGRLDTCYLASGVEVNFLTQSDYDYQSTPAEGFTLYAGGIAGKASNDDSALMTTCYTTIETKVAGGSNIAAKVAYVGGISGLNGNISECYNRAEVYSYAITQVVEITSGSKKMYEPVAAFNYGQTYVSLQEDIQIFSVVDQKAYASGLLNTNATLKGQKSVNYGIVKGGMKAKTLLGYFDINETDLKRNVLMAESGAFLLGKLDSITKALKVNPVAYNITFWGLFTVGVGLAIAGIALPFNVVGYYVDFANANDANLLPGSSGFPSYYQGAQSEIQTDPSFMLSLVAMGMAAFAGNNNLLERMFILNYMKPGLIVGTPTFGGNTLLNLETSNRFVAITNNFGALNRFKASDGQTYVRTNKVYSTNVWTLNALGPELTLFDIYYNGIAASTSSSSITDYGSLYYANEEIMGKEIDGYYWTNDINRKKDGNILVYKANSEDVRSKVLQTPTTVPQFEGWIDAGNDEFVPKGSVEVKCVEAADLLIKENGYLSKTNDTVIINVTDEFTLKTVQNLVNKYEDFVKDISEEQKGLDTFKWIESAFDPAYVGTRIDYEINIKDDINVTSNWIPLGIDPARPFAGKIVGNEKEINLLTIRSDSQDIGFIANSNNAIIQGLKLSIGLEGCYETAGHSMGGFIANANGTTVIENSMLTRLEIRDYTIDKETSKIKENGAVSTIGGYIGTASGNVTISGFEGLAEIDNSYLISSKASKAKSVGHIGGIVGKYIGIQGLTISNVFTPTILGEETYNTVVGGVIGETVDTEVSVSISNTKTQGNINIVGAEDIDEVVVGGVVGISRSILTIDGIDVNSKSIAADLSKEKTPTTLYSAGVVGKLYGTLEMTNSVIGASWTFVEDRLYISAGLKQMTRPTNAYAGEYVAFKDTATTFVAGSSNQFNGKAIAVATYNYTNTVTFKEKADGTFDIESVDIKMVKDGLKIQSEVDGMSRKRTQDGVFIGYSRVTIIETEKQEKSNTDNSFIVKTNGEIENYGQYNYKKTYFIIYTTADLLNAIAKTEAMLKAEDYPFQVKDASGKDKTKDWDPTLYQEKVYQLDIYFGIGDENKDIDYSFGYTFDSIVENTYVLVNDEFSKYSTNLSNRHLTKENLFMPKASVVTYGDMKTTKTGTMVKDSETGVEVEGIESTLCEIRATSSVTYYNNYEKFIHADGSVDETTAGNYPLYNQSSYDKYTKTYSTIGGVIYQNVVSDKLTGEIEQNDRLNSNGLKVEIDANGGIVIKELCTLMLTGMEPVKREAVILDATKSDLSSLYKEFENDEVFELESKMVNIDMVQIGNKLFTLDSVEQTFEGGGDRSIVGSKYSNYYIVSDIENTFVTEQIFTAQGSKIMHIGSISYLATQKIINSLVAGDRIKRTGLFFPAYIGLSHQSNNLRAFDDYQELSHTLQFAQINYANISILNNDNAIHVPLTQNNFYTYVLKYNASSGGWDFSPDPTNTEIADKFVLNGEIQTALYNGGAVSLNTKNYATTMTSGSQAYVYRGGKAYEVTVEGSTVTYDGTEYTIEEQKDDFSFAYSFGGISTTFAEPDIITTKRIKIGSNYYSVFDGNYLSKINNGRGDKEISVESESVGTDIIAKAIIDGVEYDLFSGATINNNITLGGYKINFTIENGTRRYVITKGGTTVYEIEGVSFDKDEVVLDPETGEPIDVKNVINGNIKADVADIDTAKNYITLEGSNLVVNCNGEITKYSTNIISRQYMLHGHTILLDFVSNQTTISVPRKVGEDAEGEPIYQDFSTTISGTEELDAKNMYLRSLNDIATTLVDSANSFINYDDEQNYICIKGSYYDSKLRNIKAELKKHSSKELEILVIYNKDGEALAYVYNQGNINIALLSGFNYATSDCQFEFNEDTGVTIIKIRQNGIVRANLDVDAKIVTDISPISVNYISDIKITTGITINSITTEDYIKYVYNGMVSQAPATHTKVELFPWDNTQKFILKISKADGTESKYYGLNGSEMEITISSSVGPSGNLTTAGQTITKVYETTQVIGDSTNIFKRIYVFSSLVSVDYQEGDVSVHEQYAFSVLSTTQAGAFDSVSYASAEGEKNMTATFADWGGVAKTFDLLTGTEYIEVPEE